MGVNWGDGRGERAVLEQFLGAAQLLNWRVAPDGRGPLVLFERPGVNTCGNTSPGFSSLQVFPFSLYYFELLQTDKSFCMLSFQSNTTYRTGI